MTLPSLATITALGDRLGDAITDTAQAQALLDYASARLRARTGCTWVDDDGELTEVPDLVSSMCVEMVFRAVVNPSGVTQDTAGPFTVSFGPDASQRIFLTGQEISDLGRVSCRSPLQTISTTRGPLESASVYVPDPIPWLGE